KVDFDYIRAVTNNAATIKNNNLLQIGTAPDGSPLYKRGDRSDPDCLVAATVNTAACTARTSDDLILTNAVEGGQTDVYSVAATLYYLLTARPPFQASDAAAALAKIVSEDPTPLRGVRPDLPPALEAAVLKGLARDRDYRFADLGRFREALLPFVSEGLRLPDLALRISGYFVDWLLMTAVGLVVFAAAGPGPSRPAAVVGGVLAWRALFVLYFGLTEGVWGASLGKRLTGLRVAGSPATGPPGLTRGLARAVTFYILVGLPDDATALGLIPLLPPRRAAWLIVEPLSLVAGLAGALVMSSTMRASNGYRGLHELVTETRVVRLPRSRRRRAPRGRKPPTRKVLDRGSTAVGAGLLKGVGTFKVAGAVIWDGRRRVLLGEDPTLKRPVWLVLRPKGAPAPSQARRDLGRIGRPRWLSGGEQGEHRWDAYSPQLGCSLADLAGPDGLPWADYAGRYGSLDMATEPDRIFAPGGDSWTSFNERVRRTMQRLADDHAGQTVVAVCHAGVIMASLREILGIPH
ncbi:MAG: RDD family protein, partial [Thermoleophilia bacterium]|nr:RDD family protein [Thermoleophilia bacterium]